MKTRNIVAILVLTGIGIGALLNAVLPDFTVNWGLGGGPETTKPTTSTPEATTETTTVTTTETTTEPPNQAPIEAGEQSEPVKTVFVLIDGRNYLLRRGPQGQAAFKPAELDEVVLAAEQATGDDNGIRVRVEQKSSARDTAERALREKLDAANVSGDAVLWKDRPVDIQE